MRRVSLRFRDRIQFTAPSKELHVANRELASVVEITTDGQITIRTDSARLVEFDTKRHPHLDYGYAVTSHSSQGQTADRVLIHVDTEKSQQLVNSRMAYVAVSRGRYDAQIFTNDKEELRDALGREVSHRSATSSRRGPQQEKAREHAQQEDHASGIGPASIGKDEGHEHGYGGQAHSEGAGQGQAVAE